MALATQADVVEWLGRPLGPSEQPRVAGLLARADAVVMGYLGCAEEPAPVPAAVTSTVAGIVGRALTQASVAGIEQLGVDDGSVRFNANASSGDVWLSSTDRLALRRFRCGGGLTSVQLVGDRYKVTQEP